ncbi:MAG: protein kinase [Verrucomicrobiota bacterium]
MGEVWHCHETVSGRPVALKKLAADLARNPEAVELFRQTFLLAETLNHPHIAALKAFESDRENGEVYLIMEYVPGANLHDHRLSCPQGRLTLDDMLDIGGRIADAIDYGHRKPSAGRASCGP